MTLRERIRQIWLPKGEGGAGRSYGRLARAGGLSYHEWGQPIRDIFDQAPVPLVIIRQHRIVVGNAAFAAMVGYWPKQLERRPLCDLILPEDFARYHQQCEMILTGGGMLPPLRMRMLNSNHQIMLVEFSGMRLEVGWHVPARHLLGLIRDIGEEVRREQTVAREQEQRRLIVENAAELIIQLDAHGRITSCNRDPDGELIMPGGELTCSDLICKNRKPCGECPVRIALDRQRADKKEIRVQERTLIISATPLFAANRQLDGAIVIVCDVTEQRQLELQLLHAQKMDAIGQLASCITHDFNNLLQVILGYADLLKNEITSPSGREMWQQVVAAGNSAKSLARQLLTFARKESELELKANDFNEIIRHLQKILGRIIGETVELDIRLTDEALPILGDAGLLEQVIMNLCINARDAMAAAGGRLTIATGRCDERIRCEISDTGEGIPPDILPRIFEPFFTTKSQTSGTGLGLSIVYSIMRKHNGEIKVTSTPGRGTTFQLFLPWHQPPVAASPGAEAAAVAEASRQWSEQPVILHVEDDENVRRITRAILESNGYRVVQAVDGRDGINQFDADPERFNVVLLDVVLPGISGAELARHIRFRRPELPLLFCSGYLPNPAGRGIAGRVIQKPFSRQDLLESLDAALDKTREVQACGHGN